MPLRHKIRLNVNSIQMLLTIFVNNDEEMIRLIFQLKLQRIIECQLFDKKHNKYINKSLSFYASKPFQINKQIKLTFRNINLKFFKVSDDFFEQQSDVFYFWNSTNKNISQVKLILILSIIATISKQLIPQLLIRKIKKIIGIIIIKAINCKNFFQRFDCLFVFFYLTSEKGKTLIQQYKITQQRGKNHLSEFLSGEKKLIKKYECYLHEKKTYKQIKLFGTKKYKARNQLKFSASLAKEGKN
ncbi:hypothetical protein ABPG72_007072 [Tetrahymena utriculariae]